MERCLFFMEREDIRVEIKARFEEEKLVIDGYDIGKSVEEYWGDSDYEYMMTLPAESVTKLYKVLHVEEGNKELLLDVLAEAYDMNECFTLLGKLFDKHKINYESFSWT
jgi:hypothetical protein